MPYEVPPLRYGYGALEPYIDEETMHLHHDKHHQAYVTAANKALEGTEWAGRPVEEVLQNLDSIPDDKRNVVRNNAGGHYNHSLFWQVPQPSARLHRRVVERRQLGQSGGELRDRGGRAGLRHRRSVMSRGAHGSRADTG